MQAAPIPEASGINYQEAAAKYNTTIHCIIHNIYHLMYLLTSFKMINNMICIRLVHNVDFECISIYKCTFFLMMVFR